MRLPSILILIALTLLFLLPVFTCAEERTISTSLDMHVFSVKSWQSAAKTRSYPGGYWRTPGVAKISTDQRYLVYLGEITPSNVCYYKEELDRMKLTRLGVRIAELGNLRHFYKKGLFEKTTALKLLLCRQKKLNDEYWEVVTQIKSLEELILTVASNDDLRKLSQLKHLTGLQIKLPVEPLDLALLTRLKNLEYLHLESKAEKIDLSFLKDLPKLSELQLNLPQAVSPQDIPATLQKLEKLTVAVADTTADWSALNQFPALTSLRFDNLKDVAFLEQLPNITSLHLSCNVDLNHLARMPQLQSLTYTGGEYRPWPAGWKNLVSLTSLNVPKNTLPIMPKLRHLRVIASYIPNLANAPLLESLDLSYHSIKDLSVVTTATNLKKLNLRWCGGIKSLEPLKKLTKLEEFWLSENEKLANYDALFELKSLKSLNLVYCSNFSGLTKLNQLSLLEELRISQCGKIRELPKLSQLKNLKTLELYILDYPQHLDKIEGFEGLDNLETLRLFQAAKNLPELSNLKKLKVLDLAGGGMDTLPSLAGLSQLEHLCLYKCLGLSKITSLKGLTSLRSLDLRYCRKAKLPALNDLVQLQSLTYRGGIGALVPPIDKLTNLKRLTANGSTFSSLSAFKNLKKLEVLDCSYSVVLGELPSLVGLNQLSVLNLEGNFRMRGFPQFDKLPNLEELNLTRCRDVDNFEPLRELKDLKTLRLSGSGIVDLRPLLSLSKIEQLEIAANSKITDLAVLATLKKMRILDLSVCKGVTDIRPLAWITNLEVVNLAECPNIRNFAPLSASKKLKRLGWTFQGNDLRLLKSFPNLEVIYFCDCPDLQGLARLNNCKNLSKLLLRDCPKVSLQEIATFKKQNPHCEVLTQSNNRNSRGFSNEFFAGILRWSLW